MGIPVLLSRSGATQMGYEIAKQLGVVVNFSRLKVSTFSFTTGAENIDVKQVAEYLQLNEKKVYSLANEGHIPATKVTGNGCFQESLLIAGCWIHHIAALLKDRLIIAGSDDPLLYRLSSNPEAFFDPQYRWAMRQKGSGAQRFLLEILSHYHKTTDLLNCEVEANSEREAAAAIAMDQADIAPGARSVATEFGLGFISLGWESFDLALPRNIWFRHLFQEFINELKSLPSQQMAESLTGYDLSSCGELVWGDD
ncbi:putative molybdopterin biosynthesis protein [Nymphon striatum]|nr:putative molybdopterin biosynthesis protein [Nymphon striatum]